MAKSSGKAGSKAQEEFIRIIAGWLNVIGQLAQTPTEDARGWAGGFCYELSDYVGKNLPRVVAGKMPKGGMLTGFCDDAWPRLARGRPRHTGTSL